MNVAVKTGLAAAALLVSIGAGSTVASAMPVSGLQPAIETGSSARISDVRWVCGPYRCWWRPNYYAPRRPWGWRRWRRW